MSLRKSQSGIITLLISFIRKRYAAHIPPRRKGTKKGEAIGFSKSKYKATLLFLFDVKRSDSYVKQVAKLVGESYNLVRKWRIEEAFLRQIEENENEFVIFFMEFIKKWHKQEWERRQTFLKQPLNVIAKTNHPQAGLMHMKELRDKLVDGRYYNSPLSMKILGTLTIEHKKALKKHDLAWCSSLYCTKRWLMGPDAKEPEVSMATIELNRTVACHLLDRAKKILCNPSTSLDKKKHLVWSLNTLQRMINNGEL